MRYVTTHCVVWRLLTLRKIFSRQRCSIVLAAMPKSGSTFLSRSLQFITGFDEHHLAQSYKNIEQELYAPKLIDAYDVGSVTQQHFRANEPNLSLLTAFEIRPVIVYRNILDVLVSMRDHLTNEALDNIPGLYPPTNFRQLDSEKQLDFLAQYAAPWLISFFVSWEKFRAKCQISSLCLYYEDCREDWPAAISKILDFYDILIDPQIVRKQVEILANKRNGGYRKNVGIKGRGERDLNPSQIDKISELACCYPEVDFSPVGIRILGH